MALPSFGQFLTVLVLIGFYSLARVVLADWAANRAHARRLAEQIQAANIRTLEGWTPPGIKPSDQPKP